MKRRLDRPTRQRKELVSGDRGPIVVGAIAGYIAAFIMHTRNGILLTIFPGIIGAVVDC